MSRRKSVHASAVLIGETGVLVRGGSGSGKSALILELLSADPEHARLVADDRVVLVAANGRLLADVPSTIAGLIEIRGLGIVRRPHVAPVVIHLVVDLEPPDACRRLPEEHEARTEIEGIALPRLALPIGDVAAAAIKVKVRIKDCFNL